MSAIRSDSTAFISDISQIVLILNLSKVKLMGPAWTRGSPFRQESTSKHSSVCARAHLFVYICAEVLGVLFIYSSACGRRPAQRAEGHGKTSTLSHVLSFLSHPPCVTAYTVCVASRLLKIDSVQDDTDKHKSPACSCTLTSQGERNHSTQGCCLQGQGICP